MKLGKYLLYGLGCVLLSAQPSISAMKSGMDNKLEWKVVREFQLESSPVDMVHSLDGKYVFVLTADKKVLAYDAKGNLQGAIPVAPGVTSIDIDPRAQYLHLSDGDKKKFYTLSIDFVLNINSVGSPTKGNIDAPVTIAVFSDFQ